MDLKRLQTYAITHTYSYTSYTWTVNTNKQITYQQWEDSCPASALSKRVLRFDFKDAIQVECLILTERHFQTGAEATRFTSEAVLPKKKPCVGRRTERARGRVQSN
eukprot:TRINITY_DN19877_c0_g1_i1.p1 TRINITY_DN19877_c0_g1~~TRINITY_DN19877_c0_g1_i1.p1  ORF type:complete len:106 (-),score=2.69 TRINITY_DN19877_c0_g1_i1:69-386(-)